MNAIRDISRALLIAALLLIPGMGYSSQDADGSHESTATGYVITFGNIWDDNAFAVDTDSEGNAYFTDTFAGAVDFDPGPGEKILDSGGNYSYNSFLAKYSASGALLWAFNWGTASQDSTNGGVGIRVDLMGSVFVAGQFGGTVDFDPGPGEDLHTGSIEWTKNNGAAFLCKYTVDGQYLWTRTWDASSFDGAYRMDVDQAGRAYVTGVFSGTVDFDPGDSVDEHTAPGDSASYVTVFNGDGSFAWARTWGGNSGWNNAHDVEITKNGDVLVTGSFGGSGDIDPGPGSEMIESTESYPSAGYVMCLDRDGEYKWSRTWKFGAEASLTPYELDTDSKSNIYLIGYAYGPVDFDPGDGVAQLADNTLSQFVCKLDATGNYLWVFGLKYRGGTMSTLSPSICVSPKDTVLVAGAFGGTVDFDPGPGVYELTSVGSRTDAYVAAFDTGGKFIWARRFGGDDDDKGDEFVGVASDADENVLLAGHIDGVADLDPGPGYNEVTAAGFRDILLVKLDSNGNLRETE